MFSITDATGTSLGLSGLVQGRVFGSYIHLHQAAITQHGVTGHNGIIDTAVYRPGAFIGKAGAGTHGQAAIKDKRSRIGYTGTGPLNIQRRARCDIGCATQRNAAG